MKELSLFTGLLILVACSNQNTGSELEIGTPSAHIEDWLAKYNLARTDFKDSSVHRAFELWAFEEKIESRDSTFHWYPSTDSSFYLISNYDIRNHSRMKSYHADIELRFHESGSNTVRLGMTLLDSMQERTIDALWADESSLYIMETHNSNEINLMLISMQHDSIWEYRKK